jgi:hypothetical protein
VDFCESVHAGGCVLHRYLQTSRLLVGHQSYRAVVAGAQAPTRVQDDAFILSEHSWVVRPDLGKVFRPVETGLLQPLGSLNLVCPIVCEWYLDRNETRTECPRQTRCPHTAWAGLKVMDARVIARKVCSVWTGARWGRMSLWNGNLISLSRMSGT